MIYQNTVEKLGQCIQQTYFSDNCRYEHNVMNLEKYIEKIEVERDFNLSQLI